MERIAAALERIAAYYDLIRTRETEQQEKWAAISDNIGKVGKVERGQ